MRPQVQILEPRRLLAGLPSALFSQASDTYTLTIGAAVPATSLTSVQWSVAPGQPQPFQVVLPSGPLSPAFLQMTMQGTVHPLIRVESLNGATVRQRWDMTSNARVASYQQFLDGGVLYDSLAFTFNRVVGTYFTPNPPGAPLTSTLDWNLVLNTVQAPPMAMTQYMSTSPEYASTMEFGRGQIPVSGYSFSTSPSAGGLLGFNSVGGIDSLPLMARVLNGQGHSGAVYTQRSADTAVPLIRTRFLDVAGMSYGFFDSTLDSLPSMDALTYSARSVQTFSYSYSGAGAMLPPVSAGWNYQTNTSFNPSTVTAFIQPPTFGARNSPLASINIQFSQAVPGLTLSHLSFENLSSAGLTLTTSNGGLNWTVGNLAAQQVTDGDYAVKLFALGSGLSSATGQLIGSTGIKWTLDTAAPSLTGSVFGYFTGHELNFVFDEDVSGSLAVGDIHLQNLTNNTTIPAGAMALAYDHAGNTATITFPGLANGILPDGNYRATLSRAQVTDAAGNPLTADVQFDFFVLAGDANRDRKVDVADLGILASNWQQSPRTFSQADFNYDGKVDVADLGILASSWQKQLDAPSAPLSSTSRRAVRATRMIDQVGM